MRRKAAIVLAIVTALAVSAAAFDPKELPNPLANAKVGDWALYDMSGRFQMRYTVVAVSDASITLKMETYANGESVFSREMEFPLGGDAPPAVPGMKEMPEDPPEPKYSKDKVTIDGKTLDCTLMEVTFDGKTTKTWISGDIPVQGLVKVESEGAPMMTLLDWGRGD